MLFAAKVDDFLTYQEDTLNNSAGEMAQKRLCLKNHLLPFFGDLTFDAISKRKIEEYAASKRKRGLAVCTINHHLTILKRYLRHAEENGYMQEVPHMRQLPVGRKQETNFLTVDEVKKLYLAADQHRTPGWKLIIIVAVNTGMRIGELLALDWASVDLPGKRLVVRASYCRQSRAVKSTKSGHERSVSLTESAQVALQRLHDLEGNPASGLVMKTEYDSAQRAMRNISERAGLGHRVTWHTLRHTFATTLVSMGQPLYVVAKLLGHATVGMAERYAHLTKDRAFAAMRDLDGVL